LAYRLSRSVTADRNLDCFLTQPTAKDVALPKENSVKGDTPYKRDIERQLPTLRVTFIDGIPASGGQAQMGLYLQSAGRQSLPSQAICLKTLVVALPHWTCS